MEDPVESIQACFATHVDMAYRTLDALHGPLERAVETICDALLAERRVIVCGDRAGAALAQVFCTTLLSRARIERPALPVTLLGNDAATLGAIADCYGMTEVFARQIQALAEPGDTVLLVCGAPAAENLMAGAVRAAHARRARVIALSAEGGADAGPLAPDDLELRVPAEHGLRVLECQLLLLDCLAESVERRLFCVP